MARVKVGDVTLNVLDEGTGPVVLLVHGFPLDHSMWREQVADLAADHRVIVPDLRGHGASDVTAGTVTMARFADDLAALLDELGVTEPIVYGGLSMGGYVGWEFVRRHRDRLRGLIVCDSRAAGDTDEGRENRARMAAMVLEHGPERVAEAMLPKLFAPSIRTDRPDLVDDLRRVMTGTDPEGIAAALRGMSDRADVTSLLPSFDVPTLLVCGEQDEITPAPEMMQIADAMPDAAMALIGHAGHMAPLEQPDVVNARIRQFLAELPA